MVSINVCMDESKEREEKVLLGTIYLAGYIFCLTFYFLT